MEHKQKNKSNQFVDHRFGEGEDVSVEEKMMRRFILERKVTRSTCMSGSACVMF